MDIYTIFLIVAFFLLFFYAKKGLLPALSAKNSNRFIYQSKPTFFSKSEYAFFTRLLKASEETHIILAKVRLADIIEPKSARNEKIYYSAFNQISRKHIDFLLLHKKTLRVEYAIELDGRSHSDKRVQMNDKFKDNAFENCDIKFFRFKVGDSFDPDAIRLKLGLEPNAFQPV